MKINVSVKPETKRKTVDLDYICNNPGVYEVEFPAVEDYLVNISSDEDTFMIVNKMGKTVEFASFDQVVRWEKDEGVRFTPTNLNLSIALS